MKFAKIISAAGLNSNKFPRIAEKNVVVYDRKNRVISEDELCFEAPIFSKNSESLKRFKNFLNTYNGEDFEVLFLNHYVILRGKNILILNR